jgi:hypothetical protein
MYSVCHKIAYLKLPCAVHHLERENLIDLAQPGEEVQELGYSLA